MIADLHIHSEYSGATSYRMTLDKIVEWCGYKGIDIVSTGDCLNEFHLQKVLENVEFPPSKLGRLRHLKSDLLFCFGTEVCLEFYVADFYKRIHVLMLFPDYESIEVTRHNLVEQGHALHDGRPTLYNVGITELIDLSCNRAVIIPAHIWTPWFGLFGAKSGFSSFEQLDYYGYNLDMVETGLSSDIEMNGRISMLDDVSCVSFSDAHSPEKIGREATIVGDVDTFDALIRELRSKPKTLEWYPHLGKYHYTGHRACLTRFKDDTTTCPVCYRQMTMGVHNRLYNFIDRSENQSHQEYIYVNSLKEIAKVAGIKLAYPIPNIKELLTFTDKEHLNKLDSSLKKYVEKYIKREIMLSGGYDGVFGKFKFKKDDLFNL